MGGWNMSLNKTPQLLVFAGPNGSGKSSITSGIPIVGTYVNADELKVEQNCSDIDAAKLAEKVRESLLSKQYSFTFETVLSTDRNLRFLERAKNSGYQIRAVFVLTSDVSINIERVKSRVAAGGHDVPLDKIRNRYEKSLQNLARLRKIADHTTVVDNSGEHPDIICEISNGAASIRPNKYWSKEDILCLLAVESEGIMTEPVKQLK